MANYSLVINSQFHPISYQEMMDPVVRTQQAQDALEDKYAELQTNASVWDGYVDEQRDRRAYAQLHNYDTQLRQASDALYRSGMNADSKRTLMNLLGRYASEIKPIENAYKARAEEIKEQRAGELNGVMYETDAGTRSIDDYLDNPDARSRQASYKESYARLAAAMRNFKNQLQGYGLGKPIDAYTNTFIRNHGITPQNAAGVLNAVNAALRGDGNPTGNNILADMFMRELSAQGVDKWDRDKQLQFFNKIAPAVYEGLGAQDVSPMANQAALQAAQDRRAALAYASRGGNGSGNGNGKEKDIKFIGDIRDIATAHGLPKDEYTSGAAKYFYSKDGGRSGKYYVNEEGRRLLDSDEFRRYNRYVTLTQKKKSGRLNAEEKKEWANLDGEFVGVKIAGLNNAAVKRQHLSFYSLVLSKRGLLEQARKGRGELVDEVVGKYSRKYNDSGDITLDSETSRGIANPDYSDLKAAILSSAKTEGGRKYLNAIEYQKDDRGGLSQKKSKTRLDDIPSDAEVVSAAVYSPVRADLEDYYNVQLYSKGKDKTIELNIPVSAVHRVNAGAALALKRHRAETARKMRQYQDKRNPTEADLYNYNELDNDIINTSNSILDILSGSYGTTQAKKNQVEQGI